MLQLGKKYKRNDGSVFIVKSIDEEAAKDIKNDKAVTVEAVGGYGSSTYTIEGKYIYYTGDVKADSDYSLHLLEDELPAVNKAKDEVVAEVLETWGTPPSIEHPEVAAHEEILITETQFINTPEKLVIPNSPIIVKNEIIMGDKVYTYEAKDYEVAASDLRDTINQLNKDFGIAHSVGLKLEFHWSNNTDAKELHVTITKELKL